MRTVYSISLLFFTASLVPFTSATRVCTDTAKWNAALNIDLRQKADKISVGSSDCTPNLFYNPWSDPKNPRRKILADTLVPQDGQLETSTTSRGSYKCDHILELQLVKEIMELPGGACDKANALFATDPDAAVEKLKAIRFHTWQHANLYMVETTTETAKGNLLLPRKGIAWYGQQQWFLVNEVYHYLWGNPGSTVDAAVAQKIDNEIHTQFGDDTTIGVSARWNAYRAEVKLKWQEKKIVTEQQICDLAAKQRAKQEKQAGRGGGGGGGGGGGSAPVPPVRRRAPTLPARMVRRHRSALAEVSVAESGVTSSLVLRAVKHKTPRSGPKSPAGPKCPCNNKQQKKVVPRSQVKKNPPPATKPRKPAQTPAKRAPNPNKRPVKRPADRARREPGKQATPKRTTPKRQPKRVPKPTRRPKGTPRTRRRGRK